MFVTQSHLHAPPGQTSRAQALHALSDAGHWASETLREWGRRIRERRQLAELDDRMLHDIGITRVDREMLSSKPFWRE